MPSVIALLEFREARAREELESWLEVVKEAEEQAAAARRRLEHACIACGEVLRALAEEAESVAGRVQAGQETLVLRPERFTGSRRPARHLAALSHRPSTSSTRATLRLAMHRTGRRELPGKPFRPQH